MSDTENPPADDPQPDPEPKPDEGDGTDWKAEARKWEQRAKKNSDAAARLQEIEDAKKSAEQKLQEAADAAAQRAEQAEAQLMRLQVAASKGLTPAQAKRLSGSTQEELEADAEELLEMLTPPKPDPPPGGRPKPLHSGNGDPAGDAEGFDPTALANQIYERGHI